MKIKHICFDMDGTIADLYSVNNWLSRLDNYDNSVYAEALPLCDMKKINKLLNHLSKRGIRISVVSWASKTVAEDENKVSSIETVKKDWLLNQNFKYDNLFVIPYGTNKSEYIKNTLNMNEDVLIFDDDIKVRDSWDIGLAIDPTKVKIEDILKIILFNLLTKN